MRKTLALLALLAGCGPAPPTPLYCDGVPGTYGVTVQLFFGRTMKGDQPISDAAWNAFLAESVTPRFPAGLTVIEARGQWRQRATGRIISQPSSIVEIVTDGLAADYVKFEAIRSDYKAKFAQESVGLVTSRSCASW
jgi:hypothetical protein